jgi:hypothetical protein
VRLVGLWIGRDERGDDRKSEGFSGCAKVRSAKLLFFEGEGYSFSEGGVLEKPLLL